jgi:hypothetical protein
MTNETKNNEATNDSVQGNLSKEKWNELFHAVHHNGIVSLSAHFNEVTGRVWNHEELGPIFIFRVKNDSGHEYECGYFLRELVGKFQSDDNPSEWMASFFVELMKNEGGKTLPTPPASDDEVKAIVDHQIAAPCITAIKEEFGADQVHAGLQWHPEHGAVLEAGFPAITEGNNVCAFKLDLLIMHVLLNRDPAELIINGLYKIREEHGME